MKPSYLRHNMPTLSRTFGCMLVAALLLATAQRLPAPISEIESPTPTPQQSAKPGPKPSFRPKPKSTATATATGSVRPAGVGAITLKAQSLSIRGIVHVQNRGDLQLADSTWAGTKGQSLRLEGFEMHFSPAVEGLGLEYMCHLQDVGDQPWVPGGSFCGTRNQSRRLEGLAIRLTGPRAADYDVYYACHLQDLGDQPATRNGGFSGTRGQSRRLEALVVWVVPKKPVNQ